MTLVLATSLVGRRRQVVRADDLLVRESSEDILRVLVQIERGHVSDLSAYVCFSRLAWPS